MEASASLRLPAAADAQAAGREELAGPPAAWPNRSASQLVTAGGRRWHLQRAGSGPRLLLLHGTGASVHSFRDLLPRLAASFDVLAPDLPGHGYSESPPGGRLGLHALACDLGELLDGVDFLPQFAVGHSAGAAILAQMALDGTLHLERLIGINAALLPLAGPSRRLFAPLARLAAATRVAPWLIARQARDPRAIRRLLEGTGSHIDDAGIALYQRLFTRQEHVAAVLGMMAQWDLDALPAALAALECPLALITASGDLAVDPREATTVSRLASDVTIERIAGCGHLVHEENPGLVARLVHDLCLGGAS